MNPVPVEVLAGVMLVAAGTLWAAARRLERARRAAESRFDQLADALPELVYQCDPQGRLTYGNARWREVTGFVPGGPMTDAVDQRIHPDDAGTVQAKVARSLADGTPMTSMHRLRWPDGKYRWHLARVLPLRDEAGRITSWLGVSTDVDDLRRDQARLQRQSQLLDAANEAIVVRDAADVITYWNRGAERLYGYTAAEAIGQPVFSLLYRDAPEAREAARQVREQGDFRGRLVAYDRHGDAHTVELHWALLRDEDGRAGDVMAIHVDVTQRVLLEQRLQQTMRLEAVGELTGGVAHDFNNILTVVLGNAELLADRLKDEPRTLRLAESIRAAAQRGAQLTQRLLAFARRQVLDPRAVQVGELLEGMRPLLAKVLRADVTLEVRTAEGGWRAEVDAAQLEHAIVNLCVNARDAMPRGGTVRVETSAVTVTDEDLAGDPDLAPGQYVRLAVTDTGDGIPPEVLPRIFEPFFSTKERGRGTGLGLSMVYGFVKQSNGHVQVRTERGQGTTVALLFPRAESTSVEPPKPRPAGSLPPGTTVLLAEDDDLVRGAVGHLLRVLGVEVVAVADGAAALEVLRSPARVDLLITDVVMPGGMNGAELADQAAAVRPGLRILFSSGYSADVIQQEGRLPPGVQLLGKPYTLAELSRKLHELLAPAPT